MFVAGPTSTSLENGDLGMNDPYNLQRFVDAQNGVWEQARAELKDGQKVGHWMWFIFPQIQGLGSSETTRYFAIASRAEAGAYLTHSILGPRLEECTSLVLQVQGKSIDSIFGYPDDLKFQSSMTLFSQATESNEIFLAALVKYFQGRFDQRTLDRL